MVRKLKPKAMARPKRVWAVVNGRGQIVLNEKGKGMLVYDKKWRAEGMLWKPSERVVPVLITPRIR